MKRIITSNTEKFLKRRNFFTSKDTHIFVTYTLKTTKDTRKYTIELCHLKNYSKIRNKYTKNHNRDSKIHYRTLSPQKLLENS